MESIKKVLKKTIKEVGKGLLTEFKDFNRKNIRLKSKHEIVTKADLMSESFIIKEIQSQFPKHAILSEESGEINTNFDSYLWIIDPIDGTTNFSMHNPLWSISIGVAKFNKKLDKFKIVMGAIYAPVLDELFFAQKGKGAFLNGRKINVSNIKSGKTLNAFCHGSRERDINIALKYHAFQKLNGFDCRQMGSAAIELAYVASGRIESIMIPGVHPWDVAAGILLVRESGGKVTDFCGGEWDLKSTDMLASNGLIHKSLLKSISLK